MQVYEQCAYQSKLARIDKIPEADRGTPPAGMKEWPHVRGERVHDAAEMFCRGERSDLIHELRFFEPELRRIRELYECGIVEMEEMWCFNRDWEIVDDDDYENIWLRSKLDVALFPQPAHAVVVDYKTGKKVGNEVKHASQGQLYAVSCFMRYPEIQRVDVEFWYLDHDLLYQQMYTRTAGLMFWKKWDMRGKKMTGDMFFDANPNKWNCKFCPYGPEETSNKWVQKNGACTHGV